MLLCTKCYLFQKPDVISENHPLTDTFGRHHTYLRISLTEKCNLRCKLNCSSPKLHHFSIEGKPVLINITFKVNTACRRKV